MTRRLEIRRHSLAQKGAASTASALSQAGVELARRVGAGLGRFDLVITSGVARATETALAMGYAVDETDGTLTAPDAAFWDEAADVAAGRPLTFAVWSEVVDRQGVAHRHAHLQQRRWLELSSRLPDGGSALVVSHGGTIECGIVVSFPTDVWRQWDELSQCDGVVITVDESRLASAMVVRVK
jgi:broad specificity phosphatase PhoE